MRRVPKITNKKKPGTSKKTEARATGDILLHLAFDKSVQANLITTAGTGKIIIANSAACKLLGYSKKELLTKNRAAIFDINDRFFKKMLRQRTADGHSTALITAIKKSGKLVPCEITSAVFMDKDGVEKSITTIADISQHILEQKNIDIKKEKIVADNIILAQVKSDSRLKQEIKLKEEQIIEARHQARETERSDIGKELHDNVNQLLGASRLYLSLSKRGGANSEMYLSRSSEYTISAIEEIRKLTKRLVTDAIKTLGLCESIENVTRDTMEVYPLKISCSLKSFMEENVNYKFKLNVFRIVQEQLNNIVKHAKATEVAISLSQNKTSIILSISDNGVGFDTAKKTEGIGISNIVSRAELYKGTASFISQPGQGCSLMVKFPVRTVVDL